MKLNRFDIHFSRYTWFTPQEFNALCGYVDPMLHTDTNKFRKGIRGEVPVYIALSVLCGSKRSTSASTYMECGTTTVWESIFMFVDVFIYVLIP